MAVPFSATLSGGHVRMRRISGRETLRDEKRSETSKYKPPRRNSQTEGDALRIFEHRSEIELMHFLRERGEKPR